MFKHVIRLVAILLIPSLLIDPAVAAKANLFSPSAQSLSTRAKIVQLMQAAALAEPAIAPLRDVLRSGTPVRSLVQRMLPALRKAPSILSLRRLPLWVRLPSLLGLANVAAYAVQFGREVSGPAAGKVYAIFQAGDGGSSALKPIRLAMKATMSPQEFLQKKFFAGKFLDAVQRFVGKMSDLLPHRAGEVIPQEGAKLFLKDIGVPAGAQNQLAGREFDPAGHLVKFHQDLAGQPPALPPTPSTVPSGAPPALDHPMAGTHPSGHSVPAGSGHGWGADIFHSFVNLIAAHPWETLLILALAGLSVYGLMRYFSKQNNVDPASPLSRFDQIRTLIAGGLGGAFVGFILIMVLGVSPFGAQIGLAVVASVIGLSELSRRGELKRAANEIRGFGQFIKSLPLPHWGLLMSALIVPGVVFSVLMNILGVSLILLYGIVGAGGLAIIAGIGLRIVARKGMVWFSQWKRDGYFLHEGRGSARGAFAIGLVFFSGLVWAYFNVASHRPALLSPFAAVGLTVGLFILLLAYHGAIMKSGRAWWSQSHDLAVNSRDSLLMAGLPVLFFSVVLGHRMLWRPVFSSILIYTFIAVALLGSFVAALYGAFYYGEYLSNKNGEEVRLVRKRVTPSRIRRWWQDWNASVHPFQGLNKRAV